MQSFDFIKNIYCIGRNYADHARELQNPVPTGEPVVFLKNVSALRGLSPSALAFYDETFHHEVELIVRVGRAVMLGSKADWDTIDGITLGLDLTRREEQTKLKAKGLPWTTAKSFAGSAVIAPFVERAQFQARQSFEFEFSLWVNNSLKQSGHSRDMLFDVPTLLTWLATFNTLAVGDIIFTGTPAGVAPIKRGDRFRMELKEPHHVWDGVL